MDVCHLMVSCCAAHLHPTMSSHQYHYTQFLPFPRVSLLCSVLGYLSSRKLDPGVPSPSLSLDLASAIYNRTSPADIVHILAKPNVKLGYVIRVLHSTVDLPAFVGPRGPWLREFSGICLEIYRTKARHAQGPMLEELNAMWQTAHDMCSLSAYHAAFADCKEGEVYDPSESHLFLTILANFNGSFIVTPLRYCLATHWSDELGHGFFGTVGEGMRIIWRTNIYHRGSKNRRGR